MVARIQAADFDLTAELAALDQESPTGDVGAVVSFVGRVRRDDGLYSLTLEHYPGMSERQLRDLEAEARRRWPAVLAVRIVHRFGELFPGDQIVLVAVSAGHRGEAFAACEFLMDWLKTRAPFWKLETHHDGAQSWVAAKGSDQEAAERWATERG